MKNSHKQAFTLVEILIVIAMITVLAAFSIPAVSIGLERAHQAKDLNNIKQLANTLFLEANENNGRFRCNETLTNSTNSANATLIFRGLLNDKTLSSPDVVSGYGADTFEGSKYDQLTSNHVAWAYFSGLTTSDDDRLPLLMTKGNTNLMSKSCWTNEPTEYDLDGSSAWGKKGMAIAYKGQNVEFKRAKNGKIKLGAGASPISDSAEILQP